MFIIVPDNTGKISEKKGITETLNYKKSSADFLEFSSPTTGPLFIAYQEGLKQLELFLTLNQTIQSKQLPPSFLCILNNIP